MIIYNVTLKVDHSVAADWQQWMKSTHIGEMMATGLFHDSRFCRLLEQDESDGLTFVVQYHCNSMEDYQKYLDHHAAAMRQKGTDRFGDKVLAFRTLMETLD
jgi:hypothetical protein